jgi:adenylate cyclase
MKRRYRHEIEAGTVEIDVYSGPHEGLIVAEIEFGSIAASERFRAPSWLGTEVTGDDRWANRSLALAGAVPPRPT